MTMRIQDALSNCCEGIKEFASSAASWIGKSVSTVGNYITSTIAKVMEIAKPYFEQIKTFARENQQSLLVAAVAFAIGAATVALANAFCRATDTDQTTTTTATV